MKKIKTTKRATLVLTDQQMNDLMSAVSIARCQPHGNSPNFQRALGTLHLKLWAIYKKKFAT